MSVVFSSPNPSYRQLLEADVQIGFLGLATGSGNVAGQWLYAYDSARLRFVYEFGNALFWNETLVFNNQVTLPNKRFGVGSIALGASSVTIANTSVGLNSIILVSPTVPIQAANPSGLTIGAVVAGTSFQVTLNNLASGAAENSLVKLDFNYLIIN